VNDDPIERYLDELFVELRASQPRDARLLLAETEEHLRDLAAAAERDGLDATAAARRAVGEYGDPVIVAGADVHRTTTPLLVRIGLSGWQLGAIGAIAIGLSGILAGLVHLFGASDSFLAADTSTTHLAAADCARWQSLYPNASTCAQAALRDWTAETIFYRIAVGLIGLVALLALVVVRRRFIRARLARPLPRVVSDAVATTAFGAIGVWLAGLGIDAIVVRSGDGAGFWLTAAPIALAAAAVYGRRLVHDINPPTAYRS
jgi:hypothetical protein